MSKTIVKKGQSVLEFLYQLGQINPSIKAFQLALLDVAPPLEQRAALMAEDQNIVDRARELRDTLRLPFWDGVMLTAANTNNLPGGLLNAATFHQSLVGKIRRVDKASATFSHLTEIADAAQAQGRLLVFVSEIEMADGSSLHIPMLDFHSAFSDHATELVTDVIRTLNLTGVLLSSGKSYHFYGDQPVTPTRLSELLAKALLFGPIVDRTWIAHQLIEGRCALRISTRADYGGPPTVVKAV